MSGPDKEDGADHGLRVIDGNLALKPRRGPGRPWKPGQSGSLSGRPKELDPVTGLSRHALKRAKAVLKSTVSKALLGDTAAAKIILDRAFPRQRLRVTLPEVRDAETALEALRTLLNAAGAGKASPAEVNDYSASLRRFVLIHAAVEQARKLAALEARVDRMGGA